MKYLILLLICAIHQPAKSDFDDAADAYSSKNYQVAFDEFFRLAKLGNKRAQFNLGVMYLNGEYVEQDYFLAYAWGKLSEHTERPEFSKIRIILEQNLSSQNLAKAKQAYDSIDQVYGEEHIYAKLSPIVYQESDKKPKINSNFNYKIIKRTAPRYPKQALNKKHQGWATIGFEIHPDGRVRNPYVIDSFPPEIFENESLKAVQNFIFEVDFAEETEPFIFHGRQTFEYALNNQVNSNFLRQHYNKKLAALLDAAEQGSAQAQYLYAIAASSNLMNKDNKIPQEEVNQWLLRSAQNGHVEAQFNLGRNILRGKGCQAEKQKGIDWIVYAAEQGHPRSSRTAYSLLTKNNNLNNTGKPAQFWLKQSAENGDADSQLDYAEFLASHENNSSEDLLIARKYLEKQTQTRDKSVKWYQVSAMIYQQQGEPKKAEKHQKKANKMANKLGWET